MMQYNDVPYRLREIWSSASGRPERMSYGFDFFLVVVTLGIWGFVCLWRMHNQHPRRTRRDMSAWGALAFFLVPSIAALFFIGWSVTLRNSVYDLFDAWPPMGKNLFLVGICFALAAQMAYFIVCTRLATRLEVLSETYTSLPVTRAGRWILPIGMIAFAAGFLGRMNRFGMVDLSDGLMSTLRFCSFPGIWLTTTWWRRLYQLHNGIVRSLAQQQQQPMV